MPSNAWLPSFLTPVSQSSKSSGDSLSSRGQFSIAHLRPEVQLTPDQESSLHWVLSFPRDQSSGKKRKGWLPLGGLTIFCDTRPSDSLPSREPVSSFPCFTLVWFERELLLLLIDCFFEHRDCALVCLSFLPLLSEFLSFRFE